MKSFLALERSATFTCRKAGIERVYLVYEGEEFVNYELISESATNEENGVKAQLSINNWEKGQFISKARQKLAYYDTAVLIIDGVPEVGDIRRNELFQYSSMSSNNYMHLCLKDVYYSIDWEALGISQLQYPIALRFDLDSGITPTPSRESYITNEKTKKLILKRIEEVAEWMTKKYNDTVREFATFREAYPYLGVGSPSIHLDTDKGGIALYITSLMTYSRTQLLHPRVKGVSLRDPNDYKRKQDELFYEWIPVGYYNENGKYKTSRMYMDTHYYFFSQVKNPVIVDSGMKGNVKDFLKQKHGKGTLFLRANPDERKLGGNDPNVGGWYSTYRSVLDLGGRKRSEWKKYIEEWKFVRDQVSSEFIDERGCENTQAFSDWVEKKKELMKANRKAGIYKGLNKQVGDVTLAYLEKRTIGTATCWRKKAFPVANLEENHYLTVLVEESEKKLAEEYWRLMATTSVKWATVGKLEAKKIENNSQFINFQQFMSRDCKPFMRLTSALLFDRALKEFYAISKHKNGIFQACLKPLLDDANKLEVYVKANLKDVGDVTEEIMTVAETTNLYDKRLWDVYLRLKAGVGKYDFVTCLQEPRTWDKEENKRYNKIMSQILLFRKKYYDDLPSNARIVFDEEKLVKTN